MFKIIVGKSGRGRPGKGGLRNLDAPGHGPVVWKSGILANVLLDGPLYANATLPRNQNIFHPLLLSEALLYPTSV